METLRSVRFIAEGAVRIRRQNPERVLVALAAFQSHADLCGVDALRKEVCEACGDMPRIHTIWPDGNYYCLRDVVWKWPAERQELRLEDCPACEQRTFHATGYRDRPHCVSCWTVELKRLADAVGGIAVENAAARRARVDLFHAKPVRDLMSVNQP